jgi:disulfide bond formation protein DsbB
MARPIAPARGWLFAMAVVCLAGVVAALVSQYVFDMQPCPWCILQRLVFVVIGIACLVGALLPAPSARKGFAALALLLAAAGISAALWQNLVAARSASCNLTLADRIVTTLQVESMVPWLFQIKASCADAAVKMLGVPYEFWSLALYALIALAALRVLSQPR